MVVATTNRIQAREDAEFSELQAGANDVVLGLMGIVTHGVRITQCMGNDGMRMTHCIGN